MADVAKSAVVSSETHNGLRVDDKVKNSPNNDPNDLTEFNETNRTNNSCSNRNSCSSVPDKPTFDEIDSFSELSFRTTDEISLQDLIESEFAARISNINGDKFSGNGVDDMWAASGTRSSRGRDSFEDLFEEDGSKDFDMKESHSGNEEESNSGKVFEMGDDPQSNRIYENVSEVDENPQNISSPISNSPEGDYFVGEEEFIEHATAGMSKASRPMDMPVMTTFDPFARIEEDSDYSNSNSQPNVLNSPDEFPFPESPGETKEWAKIGRNHSTDVISVEGGENVAELFTKTRSDENLECFSDQNYEDHGDLSKFHVINNMSSVESVNNSCLTMSALTSPDRNSADLSQTDELTKTTSQTFHLESEDIGDFSESHRFGTREFLRQDSATAEEDSFVKDCSNSNIAPHEFEFELNADQRIADRGKLFDNVEEDWITVEDALNRAEGDDFSDVLTNVDASNICSYVAGTNQDVDHNLQEISNNRSNDAKTIDAVTCLKINGVSSPSSSESEVKSESNSSEKKTIKKKKSKKGKKSDEKENISVDFTPGKRVMPSTSLPTTALDDCRDLANVSVKNLMQTYCSEASRSFHNGWYNKDIVPSPVPIQHLRARSMVDLTGHSNKVAVLRSNLIENFETSRSTTNLSNVERHPIVTGVSVRALKERYCSMINLIENSDPGEIQFVKKRAKIRVPWSEALNMLRKRSSRDTSPQLVKAKKGFNPEFEIEMRRTEEDTPSQKSSFSKFDQLSKKTVFHVRSVDASKVQKQFNEASVSGDAACNCKSCGKQVFQMEQIKAERAVWHKNCFRCKECNKQLTVDTYSSNEGILYCKPHFKELFKPKAVLEDELEPVPRRKPELIIRENQPIELPPEVVRASDKPDLGLEELSSLNVKSRFQVFEKAGEEEKNSLDRSPSSVNVKRSPSILSKLAKFQKKGMDIGVTDDSLNGIPQVSSTSSEEEEEEPEDNDRKVIKSKKIREKPISFGKMDDVKSVWENGVAKTKEELREERKQEIQQIRSRLFMGKQVKMKEAYEQAVRESETMSPRKCIDIQSEKAKSIKECFEKGEPLHVDEDEDDNAEKKKIVDDDISLIEAGISKKSRSLFLELDKSAKNQPASFMSKPAPKTPVSSVRANEANLSRQSSDNVVKCSDAIEEVKVETAEISSKFKFFETYQEPEKEKKKFRITPPREGQLKSESPEKEIYRDPNVVRASDKLEQEIIRTNTASKMLSIFRQMEEKTEEIPEGPKPLKRFTPPPDYKKESEEDSEEDEDEDEESEEEEEVENDPNIVRSSDKIEDEYLKQAANVARAKQLRAKFEKWEEKEREREREEMKERQINGSTNNAITENSENVEMTSIECTKSLRARFESLKNEAEQTKEKSSRPKVNRFVEIQNNLAELCYVCSRRVYQLEKVETSGKIFHKNCFRCIQCKCLLRMETFTLNCDRLYCLPHFKQLFITKGNYDEGFGVDQHKTKWPTVASF